MGELESNEILNRTIKEFRDYEFIIAEDDYWGRWNQDTVEWLLKPIDVDIKVRDKDDEVTNMIDILKQGSGILLKDFIMRERKKEEEAFKLLMQNKAVVRAVAENNGVTEDEINQIYNTGKTIPDSVLNSFNTMDGETDFMQNDEYAIARNILSQLESYERSMMR